MNLRIKNHELRFRITKEELSALCEGKVIQEITQLPGDIILTQKIELNDSNGEKNLELIVEKNNFTLKVQKDVAVSFYQSLPNRTGIMCKQEVSDSDFLTLVLDVDVFTQKRKRNKNEP